MEAELIALISLLGMIGLCSGILAKIKSGTLCCNSRITPLVGGEHSGNIPPAEHSGNIPPPAIIENSDVFENV